MIKILNVFFTPCYTVVLVFLRHGRWERKHKNALGSYGRYGYGPFGSAFVCASVRPQNA